MAMNKKDTTSKDSGFSKPYGPFGAKVAKKIAADITKGKTKKVTPKSSTNVTPKPTAKATAKKPALTKSEKDFLAGQKLKEKITKRTGVYPNTAN